MPASTTVRLLSPPRHACGEQLPHSDFSTAAAGGKRRVRIHPVEEIRRHAEAKSSSLSQRADPLGAERQWLVNQQQHEPFATTFGRGTASPRWSAILRVASIRTGTVTASLIMRQLASCPRQNGVPRGATEVDVTVHALNRILAFGCPISVPVA